MIDYSSTLFESADWLLSHSESDTGYRYHKEVFDKRKQILNVMGMPYFEEIKINTKVIQDILKKNGYTDIDLQIKALFVDGIGYFLNLKSNDSHLNDKKWLYLRGLFDSLKINIDNKELLKEILSELGNGGEDLPESPIRFLQDYGNYTSNINHKTNNVKPARKQSQSDHDVHHINIFESLDNILVTEDNLRKAHNRLEGKEFMRGHYAFDDTECGKRKSREDVIIYKDGDEYIPCSNRSISIELLIKLRIGSIEDLEEMYNKKYRENDLYYFKGRYKTEEDYRMFLQRMLQREFNNLLGMYDEGDRFIVIGDTYKDKELSDIPNEGYIPCWYVNIKSQNTGKIYRVLSQ